MIKVLSKFRDTAQSNDVTIVQTTTYNTNYLTNFKLPDSVTVVSDRCNNFDLVNRRYIVPYTGVYEVSIRVGYSNVATRAAIAAFIDDVIWAEVIDITNAQYVDLYSKTVGFLNKGANIKFARLSNLGASPDYSLLWFKRLG